MFAALKSDDEMTRKLAELMGRFGDAQVADAADALCKRLWRPEQPARKQGGRPPMWDDEALLSAWLAVEGQWRADKKVKPDCKLATSLNKDSTGCRAARKVSGAFFTTSAVVVVIAT
jgi:hypothetical protein